MFFDQYPYSNWHNVNLDWVLQAVKAWGQTVEANDRAFRDLQEANEDFKEYVTSYLQDLDVSEEINAKLDEMLASGVLTPYFAPYVQTSVNSWLNSHITPTSPALDNTLTLSGAAARSDTVGSRLKDAAYTGTISQPAEYAMFKREDIVPGYRINAIAYDYNGNFFVCGGSTAANGTGMIAKMSNLDFSDAVITEIALLGHANDITYYDGFLYVCTANNGGVAEGNAPLNQIWRINAADFTDKTLISNCPENTIGIAYRQGDFWILAPYQIYRTTDFTTYEVIVDNTNTLMTSYGIPTEGRLSQSLFRAAGYLMGWCCAFVHEDQHYGAITYFSSTGQPVDFDMFPCMGAEFQGAVYDDMSIWMVTDGNMVNILRADPRHLSYTMLDGHDLDRLTAAGTYYSTGASVSAGLVNSPVTDEGFTLTVSRLGLYNVQQTIDSNTGRHLTRRLSFDTWEWSAWESIAAVGLSEEAKQALLDCFAHVAWTDEHGQDYYDALQEALYPSADIISISAVYTQSGTVYDTDTLDSLKPDLVVTAHYSDSTSGIVTGYTLSGTLAVGTSTVTVSYGGETTTFSVTVTEATPLYSVPDFAEQSVTVSGAAMKVSKTDGVYTLTTKSAGAVYVYPNGTLSASKSNTAWFSTVADKPLKNQVIDIEWDNPNSVGAKLAVKYAQSNTTGNLASAEFTMSAGGSGTGDSAEYTNDAYTDKSMSCIALQFARLSGSGTYPSEITASFKIRLYVDGARYL